MKDARAEVESSATRSRTSTPPARPRRSAGRSPTVTLSTFHGCPPDEIEAIVEFLMEEMGLHVTVKLNPTLLGYDA